MKVCVVGSGGREHALARTLSIHADVVVTPGSPGIEGSTGVTTTDIEADLYVVGPEVPLVEGLADDLRSRGRHVFGPGSDGAMLEGSKIWMKELVDAAGVPTARYESFHADEVDQAVDFLSTLTPPYVVKTDGLAAGKGVLVTNTYAEAVDDIRNKLCGNSFGEAGRRIVIEEGLHGPELSLFALCDGQKAVLIPTAAQDHKRLLNDDYGPNTGGMGCYSPLPELSSQDLEQLMDVAIHPTVNELQNRGIDYRGVLFAGFMLTAEGPKLLEYNIRFGDPEAQVILPRLEGDIAQILMQVALGDLKTELKISEDSMVTVVLAVEGYPASPRTGDLIQGIEQAEAVKGATVFCAGVKGNNRHELVTGGGRVLNVCGRGSTLSEARKIAYEAVSAISWPGMQHRTDIGASIELETVQEEIT
tara:strand:- start:10689 stop:11942 length:1254 start_codon:yes stop_codon:yes gene_type:complete